MNEPRRRKGAVRRSDIPPDVLRALNQGQEETITLVEWLAIDMGVLLSNILVDVGLGGKTADIMKAYQPLREEGVTRRLRGVGRILFEATRKDAHREEVFENLATHTSDMVRAWAAFTLAGDETLALEERLGRTRRFAADGSVAVRECSWDSFRPYVVTDLTRGFRLLKTWVRDKDPNIRRCAIEGTRPRGVWTQHIEALKDNPEPGLVLLRHVKSDPSRYVQKAVANWLNDASKSQPDWVRKVCALWTEESPTEETLWIVDRALRTLRKQSAL